MPGYAEQGITHDRLGASPSVEGCRVNPADTRTDSALDNGCGLKSISPAPVDLPSRSRAQWRGTQADWARQLERVGHAFILALTQWAGNRDRDLS
jgi:hypothetical protein